MDVSHITSRARFRFRPGGSRHAGTGGSLTVGRVEITSRDGVVVAAAIAVGLFGAVAYYSQVLRPLAHTYSIWLLLVAVIAARQTPLRGAVRGGVGLLVSVLAFYYGKQLLYDIIYSSAGLPYRVSAEELLLWGRLGLVGGAGLGFVCSRIGRLGWLAAGSSAVITALLIVEAYQRYRDYGDVLPAACAVVATAVVLAVGNRTGRQLIRTAYMLVPASLSVSLILTAPDWIQTTLRW